MRIGADRPRGGSDRHIDPCARCVSVDRSNDLHTFRFFTPGARLRGTWASQGSLAHINEAITTAEKSQEKWVEAEIHRTAGEIAFTSPEPDLARAGACFERALVVAREQKAKSWELRTAMSLARLWRDQGKLQQAHDLLTPVYGWFTEGFRTRDLRDAKALLDALSS
jgi:predicted ATPase